jgi:hypothetical protein
LRTCPPMKWATPNRAHLFKFPLPPSSANLRTKSLQWPLKEILGLNYNKLLCFLFLFLKITSWRSDYVRQVKVMRLWLKFRWKILVARVSSNDVIWGDALGTWWRR